MTIAAILQNKGAEVLTVAADTTVREAVELLAERRIGALPVVRGGIIAGIMSERDIIYCLQERRRGGPRLARRADHDRPGDHGRAQPSRS